VDWRQRFRLLPNYFGLVTILVVMETQKNSLLYRGVTKFTTLP